MKEIQTKKNMKKFHFIMAAALLVAACAPKEDGKVPAIDMANLDTSVAPGDNFYQYATGGWQKNHPLGPQYARFGAFDMLSELNVERLNDLFASMTTMSPAKGTDDQKIVDLYKMGLDSLKLNAEGGAPLKPYIDEVYAIGNKADMVKKIAQMHSTSESPFFGAYVSADLIDSNSQILYLGQGGLGLSSNRDYYVDPKNEALKKGYRDYLEKVLTLAGVENPSKVADNTLKVEDYLALNSWSSVQQRDVEAGYNPMSTKDFCKAYPGFDFAAYFAERGIPDQPKIVIGEPSFFKAFSDYFKKEDISVLKDYLVANIVSGGASSLSDDFYNAYFDFFSRQMSGVQEQRPRWRRAMTVPNGLLGEAVGKMYVERYFPESSKEMMKELVENLRVALKQHIDELDWMGEETKAKAREKLAAFTVKIGYPDKWKDYSSLEIDPSKSYYDNLRAASAWYTADNMADLGKPTDRERWGMSPQTVNAYYNPTTNEICFPAAILQPPFFNPDADEAVNYGGIGVVIGHEMSHGFDDQGRLFDAEGNMSGWWTEEDDKKFSEKAEKLAAQFDAVEILPGLMADGHLTLGENIGDHGGLSIAFTAMQNAIKDKNVGLIDGFTPEQRFYLSYATIWAQNITPEEMRRRTAQDVHSLAVNRVNVSVRNFESFFKAFDIKEGDPMFRPESERVHIW